MHRKRTPGWHDAISPVAPLLPGRTRQLPEATEAPAHRGDGVQMFAQLPPSHPTHRGWPSARRFLARGTVFSPLVIRTGAGLRIRILSTWRRWRHRRHRAAARCKKWRKCLTWPEPIPTIAASGKCRSVAAQQRDGPQAEGPEPTVDHLPNRRSQDVSQEHHVGPRRPRSLRFRCHLLRPVPERPGPAVVVPAGPRWLA